MIKNLKKHQRTHRTVSLYRWQITMRLASEIDALKKKRRRMRPASDNSQPKISFDS